MTPVATPSQLSEYFSYCADTGEVRWIKSPRSKVRVGDVAGVKHHSGYLMINFKNRKYMLHRVIWAIVNGSWPAEQIDHINGDRADNRIANLRECSVAENMQNKRTYGRKSGRLSKFAGVTAAYKGLKPWRAQIKIDKKQINLGYFYTEEEANICYLNAKKSLHGFNPVPREKQL